MKKILFFSLIAATSLGTIQVNAQDKVKFTKEQLKMMDDDLFIEMFTGVSSKKTSTVILKDGRKIEGSATDINRKKGQIYSIDIKDASGKKTEYKAEEIAEMYLPISGMARANKINSYFGNSKNWGRKNINKSTNVDEVYVKNVKASLKNKKEEKEFLMQLINPDFSNLIEVYADPNASETSSFSVGGSPSFGGGVTKSYYIKKGDEVIWLEKADFEDQYAYIFGDNEKFMKNFPYKSIKWEHLSYLVAEYTKLSLEG